MKKQKRHVMRKYAILALVALIAAASATFAWFSSGTSATVNEFEFSADAQTGILLSVDAESWSNSVSLSDIVEKKATLIKDGAAQSGAMVEGSAIPVSTAGTITTKPNMDFFSGSLSGNTITTTAASSGYYKFNLYFKNDSNDALKIQLNVDTADDGSKVVDGTTDKDLQNAVRVGFVNHGSAENGTNAIALPGTGDSTKSIIWEPNDTIHGSFAVNQRGRKSTGDTKQEYLGIDSATTFTAGTGVNTGIVVGTEETPEPEGTKKVTTVASSSTDTVQDVLEIPANEIAKTTVYVWIEGQDVDCNNAESGGSVKTTLKFTYEKKA